MSLFQLHFPNNKIIGVFQCNKKELQDNLISIYHITEAFITELSFDYLYNNNKQFLTKLLECMYLSAHADFTLFPHKESSLVKGFGDQIRLLISNKNYQNFLFKFILRRVFGDLQLGEKQLSLPVFDFFKEIIIGQILAIEKSTS